MSGSTATADRRPDLDEILEAPRRSPSSRNTQPWDFVVVTDRDRLRELAKVWFGGAHIASSAATIGLVVSLEDAERPRIQFDLGQVTMSIMLAAEGLGIGSCHSAVGERELAQELLGYPADRTCELLISLGYPASRGWPRSASQTAAPSPTSSTATAGSRPGCSRHVPGPRLATPLRGRPSVSGRFSGISPEKRPRRARSPGYPQD